MAEGVPARRRVVDTYRIFGQCGPYKDTMGLYHEHIIESHGTKQLRSVYKHHQLRAYLYFHPGDKAWAISSTPGSSKCWMFVNDLARKPHLIVRKWRYLNSADKKWKLCEGMGCEPAASASESTESRRRTASLEKQTRAMESVTEALMQENEELSVRLQAVMRESKAKEAELRATLARLSETHQELAAEVRRVSARGRRGDSGLDTEYKALERRREALQVESRRLHAAVLAIEKRRSSGPELGSLPRADGRHTEGGSSIQESAVGPRLDVVLDSSRPQTDARLPRERTQVVYSGRVSIGATLEGSSGGHAKRESTFISDLVASSADEEDI